MSVRTPESESSTPRRSGTRRRDGTNGPAFGTSRLVFSTSYESTYIFIVRRLTGSETLKCPKRRISVISIRARTRHIYPSVLSSPGRAPIRPMVDPRSGGCSACARPTVTALDLPTDGDPAGCAHCGRGTRRTDALVFGATELSSIDWASVSSNIFCNPSRGSRSSNASSTDGDTRRGCCALPGRHGLVRVFGGPRTGR